LPTAPFQPQRDLVVRDPVGLMFAILSWGRVGPGLGPKPVAGGRRSRERLSAVESGADDRT